MNPFALVRKSIVMLVIRIGWLVKPGSVTPLIAHFLRSNGAHVEGMPNYISAKVWFDGTDYSLISLGEGCTISSNVRVLTHDAAINTVSKEMGIQFSSSYIRKRPVVIGRHCFVGTGSIIMPGAEIGAGSIVAAGSVVRGRIPPLSIVMGSPASVVGSVREYVDRILSKEVQIPEQAD